jgi:preprotein translocase subunit SecY
VTGRLSREFQADDVNSGWKAFSDSKDLHARIFLTILLLIIYRVGTYVPMPGIDPVALEEFIGKTSAGIIGMFNVFAGGAVGRMAVFALGIMPYVSASIVVQLLSSMLPSLMELKKEGERGRTKINQYTRYATVLLALIQGYSIAVGLEKQGLALFGGHFFRMQATVVLVGGTIFLMWLGDQITSRGIGNGISLIIFVGIIAGIPRALAQLFESGRNGQISSLVVVFTIIFGISIVYLVVFCERSQRRIPIQYPRRQVAARVMQGERSHLPLKINTAGVIPPIFASSVLLLPVTAISFSQKTGGEGFLQTLSAYLGQGQPGYIICFAGLIIFFAFFYTSIVLNPEDIADTLRSNGGFIPGIRPGKNTAEYLDGVLLRLTAFGSLYLAFVCLVPEIFIQKMSIPFYFGGTSLLIVVSVTIDVMSQVQSHIFSQKYNKMLKKSRTGSKKSRKRLS